MKLHELKPNKGSKKKSKRVGRGNASGMGTYSTRGMKGQKSRSGVSFYPGFEGGRTPLVKLIPKKKGFKTIKETPVAINVKEIEARFKDGDKITKSALKKAGLIKSEKIKVKLLSFGDLTKKVTIYTDKASKAALDKIEKKGGKVIMPKVTKKEDASDKKPEEKKKK